jgi:hypothetical protein
MSDLWLGTWAWVQKTGGKIAWHDRLTLVAQGIRAQAAARLSGRLQARARYLEVEDIHPPDSAICAAATALSAAASQPYLFNHCLRAYAWARLLNGHAPFDDEAVYTAMMLHDLGLTDRYRLAGDTVQCFTLPAARVAHGMAIEHGWGEQRARLVADAICLHLNVIVSPRHGREAELVRMGSGADVIGQGLNRVAPDQRAAILARHPRLDFKVEIGRALEHEVTERPCCRIAYLYRRLAFDRRVSAAPFAH